MRTGTKALAPGTMSDYLRDIFKVKVGNRPESRRFFGEAYVASIIKHREGYYGSFKWLTNPAFLSAKAFPAGDTQCFKEEFRAALHRHFGAIQLAALQKEAGNIKGLGGQKAVAPDLWLIDRHGNHRFIEVKLPGDTVAVTQLAGMAAIACCLRAKKELSVEIIELHPE